MPISTGIFSDVVGVTYRCDGTESNTNSACEFYYHRPDAAVTFSIGSLVLGTAAAKPIVTVLDLVTSGGEGSPDSALSAHHPANPPANPPAEPPAPFGPGLLNRARLLFSLTPALGFESPVVIDSRVREIVSQHAADIDLDAADPSSLDGVLGAISRRLAIPTKTLAHTRNHLRRLRAGFKVLRDLRIPTRDGAFVLGDVYLPVDAAAVTSAAGAGAGRHKYPALLSCTIYGKRVVYSGPNPNDAHEVAEFERAEDDWHTTPADTDPRIPNTGPWFGGWARQRAYETIATFNTFAYVPRGFAMVKIDPRGVAQTPGLRVVPGQQARDYADAVEWAADQPWCTGSVALVGNSYGANSQWATARLRPRGLRCIVPYASDLDPYREVCFTGGVPTLKYLTQWHAGVQAASPRWQDASNPLDGITRRPFFDGAWAAGVVRPEEVEVPVFLAAAQLLIIHGRGAFEAWTARTRRKANNSTTLDNDEKNDNNDRTTHLQLVDCNYYPWPNHQAVPKILQFLNHHLKGHDLGHLEPVGIQVRTGNAQWEWREATDWPVPGTVYTKWHLTPNGTLTTTQRPSPAPKTLTFSSDVPPSPTAKGRLSFTSAPLPHPVVFAGHFTATLRISSTFHDADIVVTLWALDAAGEIVRYSSSAQPEPIAKGFLRASHRALDPRKTRPEKPWHTHTKADNRPLVAHEPVEVNVEIYPAAARLETGWRLRLDVSGCEDVQVEGYVPPDFRQWIGEANRGESTTLHLGAEHENWIMCPVVPLEAAESSITSKL